VNLGSVTLTLRGLWNRVLMHERTLIPRGARAWALGSRSCGGGR
jgi:hypothetical protein